MLTCAYTAFRAGGFGGQRRSGSLSRKGSGQRDDENDPLFDLPGHAAQRNGYLWRLGFPPLLDLS